MFDSEAVATALPAVVAIVATHGAPSLEGCLRSLLHQEYPELTVLVVDDGPESGVVARLAALDPTLLVMHRDAAAQAAGSSAGSVFNEVLGKVSGAPFLLLVRDDVALDASATRVMVEEAFRSNAAIVGPKLVAADDPTLLLDVGSAIDHYGTPFSPIEPGERDQEQHDGVRDVFFVSDSVMLVRADIFATLAGFDPACSSSAAIDFSWRARLAGGRVIVAPDARGRVARQHTATAWPLPDARASSFGRIRTCVKSASTLALVWSIPMSFLFTLAESLVSLATGRAEAAQGMLLSWFDATRSVANLGSARTATQALRAVDDAEYRVFMIRGNARLRNLVTRRLHVDDRLADASIRTREVLDEASGRFRHVELALVGFMVLIALVATRGFVTGSLPNVGGFAQWGTTGHLFGLFSSAHRSANFGADAVAPPLFGVAGLWTLLFFGKAELAHTALVVLAAPIGIVSSYRLVRRMSAASWPAVAAAVAYGSNPVLRNAIANAELGSIVAFAVLPGLVSLLLTFPGEPQKGPEGVDGGAVPAKRRGRAVVGVRRRRRATVAIAIVTAAAAAFAPILVLAPFVIGIASVLGALCVGVDIRLAMRQLATAASASCLAFVLLLPWSLNVFAGDGASVGIGARRVDTLWQLVSFRDGPNGAGALVVALFLGALLPLLVAQPAALRVAVTGWILAVVGIGSIVVAQHVRVDAPLPELGILLSLSALGLAISIGVGVAAVVSELRTFVFGLRQVTVVLALVTIVVPVVSWIGDLGDGRVNAPHADWDHALNWMDSEAKVIGDFRVLWVGDSGAIPGPQTSQHGVWLAVSNGANLTAASLLAPTTRALRIAGEAVDLARRGATTRLGHILAPMGIRYVAVVQRRAPDAHNVGSDVLDVSALNDQLDFTVIDSTDGINVFRNLAWARNPTVLPGAIPSDARARRDPIGAALTSDLSGGQSLGATNRVGSLFVSESSSSRWSATLAGSRLGRTTAFGWANGWRSSRAGRLIVGYAEPTWRFLLIGAQCLLWLGVIAFGFRPRRSFRGAQ